MGINDKVQEAIDYLEQQDLNALAVGKYPVNEDFYFMIQEYEAKAPDVAKLEAHEKWVDIQWVISGKEAIDTTERAGLTEKIPYNPEKDVTIYEDNRMMMRTVLTAGSYMVLYPENVHKPGLAVGTPVMVKKCVGKVRL